MIEVIGRTGDAAGLVDGGVGVHRAIAEEPEGGAVEVVGTGLGDHVDDTAAGAADFRSEAGGVHLEFLNRVLGEGVRIATAAGAAGALAEEEVVGITAVDED